MATADYVAFNIDQERTMPRTIKAFLLASCVLLVGCGSTAAVVTTPSAANASSTGTLQAAAPATAAATPNTAATVQAEVAATVQAIKAASTPTPASTPTAKPAPTASITFTNANWDLALTDANKYKNAPVVLTGRIFQPPQVSSTEVDFQMYTDPVGSNGNTIVATNPSISLKNGDYVRVTGKLLKAYDGTNAFGGKVSAPVVLATDVAVVTREAVVAPAIQTYKPNKAIDQHGLVLTLTQVQLAKQETRIYITAKNGSTQNATVYASSIKIVQGSRQLEEKSVYDSGYPTIPSTLLAGVEASAVVIFDALDVSQPLRIVLDGANLSDYSLTFVPYTWTVGP